MTLGYSLVYVNAVCHNQGRVRSTSGLVNCRAVSITFTGFFHVYEACKAQAVLVTEGGRQSTYQGENLDLICTLEASWLCIVSLPKSCT